MTAAKTPMDKAGCEQQELGGTLPKLLLRHYLRYGDSRVALRGKDRGIWISYTWKQYFDIVSALALAFREMGLRKGDKVAIIGENKPHVYWFELAVLSCGGVVLGIFADCSSEEVQYFVTHSDASFVVCQDQEQVDKMLAIKGAIPKVKKVIYWEEKGLWNYSDTLLLTMKDMLGTGKELLRHHKGDVEEMILSTNPEDMATLLYSSGTTGLPRAAMHTHWNNIRMAEAMDRNPLPQTSESVSFLPIAWIAEQLFNVSYSLVKGFTVNFPEKQETVQEDIRAIGPHVLILTPRVWEGEIGTVRMKIEAAFWFNRACYNAAMRVASKVVDAKRRGVSLGAPWRVLHAIADFCVFRSLRDRLGLSRIQVACCGSTSVSPDLINYFHMIGIPLVQIYGSSECGIATMHNRDTVRPETCGTPLDGYEITISDSGEILVRCDWMFKGYYKDPEKTASALDGGVYHTGDFGRLDADGHLIVMDRLDDLRKIGTGGKVFSPQFAEVRLRFSEYIKDVLVVGREGSDNAVALINIDLKNVGLWAEKRRIVYTTFSDLTQKKEVIGLVRSEISKVNVYLPEYAQIGRFLNLHKEFDPDEAEMTRTRKVRREFIEEKYQELIGALFEGKDQIEISATVEYRDGSKVNVRSAVFLNDIQGGAPR